MAKQTTTHTVYRGGQPVTVALTIDLDALALEMARKAQNRGKPTASACLGSVKVKVVGPMTAAEGYTVRVWASNRIGREVYAGYVLMRPEAWAAASEWSTRDEAEHAHAYYALGDDGAEVVEKPQ